MSSSISLVTTTLNAAATLRSCLESVVAQSLPVEHLVIDGGSADGTLALVAEFGDQIACCLSEPDAGLYDALNKGISRASGEIIGILHADDYYPSPDILAKVAGVFADPEVEACYGDLLYVKPGSVAPFPATGHRPQFDVVRYWRAGPFNPQKFYNGWMPPHPTLFVRREVYLKHGAFRLDLGTAADYELMLRFLLRKRIRCAYLPEILVCMRVGGASNRSLAARIRANRMDRKAWEVNGLQPYPWTLVCKPLRKVSQWWRRP